MNRVLGFVSQLSKRRRVKKVLGLGMGEGKGKPRVTSSVFSFARRLCYLFLYRHCLQNMLKSDGVRVVLGRALEAALMSGIRPLIEWGGCGGSRQPSFSLSIM